MNKIKYLLFAGGIPNEYSPDKLVQSGLYCWPQAFNRAGCSGYASSSLDPEFLRGFDVIHINYVPGNIGAIEAIHRAIKNSSTKLIMNIDYSIALQASIDPYLLKACSDKVDLVFHVEPRGAELMSYYLKRPVPVNTHPCCVELLGSMYRNPGDVVPVVTCQYHRYQFTWPIYFYSTIAAREDGFVKTVLANYKPGSIGLSVEWFFDDVLQYCSYQDYIPHLARSLLNMDMPPDYVGGRGVVDAAALGIPTIGSCTNYAQTIIWPELALDPFDFKGASELFLKFKNDPEFYGEMVKRGTTKAHMFGLDASRKHLLKLLEEL